ncbi:hypothetical protein ACWODI_06160 [Facklamia languida]
MQDRSMLVIALCVVIGILSIRNFKIRSECQYPAMMTAPLKGAVVISMAILVWVALTVGRSVFDVWLALMCGLYLYSVWMGRGIHERGIYYSPGRNLWLRCIPWENIQSIEIDLKNGLLVSFDGKKHPYTYTVRQNYSPQALDFLQEKVPSKIV